MSIINEHKTLKWWRVVNDVELNIEDGEINKSILAIPGTHEDSINHEPKTGPGRLGSILLQDVGTNNWLMVMDIGPVPNLLVGCNDLNQQATLLDAIRTHVYKNNPREWPKQWLKTNEEPLQKNMERYIKRQAGGIIEHSLRAADLLFNTKTLVSDYNRQKETSPSYYQPDYYFSTIEKKNITHTIDNTLKEWVIKGVENALDAPGGSKGGLVEFVTQILPNQHLKNISAEETAPIGCIMS